MYMYTYILPAGRSLTERRLISFQAFLHRALASAFVAPVRLYKSVRYVCQCRYRCLWAPVMLIPAPLGAPRGRELPFQESIRSQVLD